MEIGHTPTLSEKKETAAEGAAQQQRNDGAKSTLIVDMDNTLFDWVQLWYQTFTALLDGVELASGVKLRDIEAQIRSVHQRHGTSEYAFLLDSLPALEPFRQGRPASEVFISAIRAFRAARKTYLNLYPSVAETLLKIKGSGAQIIAYTESLRHYSFYRVKRLGLDGVIDYLYSPEDHAIPDTIRRYYADDFYSFKYTKHRFTPPGELKPNAHILATILSDCGSLAEEAVYVGDSLHKDMAMANAAGVTSAWARYGETQGGEAYSLLKRVTHWTDDDVLREAEIRALPAQADVILDSHFGQVLDHFRFGERHGTRA
jgi:FMN phosphatase YigB (HAD superfamily)